MKPDETLSQIPIDEKTLELRARKHIMCKRLYKYHKKYVHYFHVSLSQMLVNVSGFAAPLVWSSVEHHFEFLSKLHFPKTLMVHHIRSSDLPRRKRMLWRINRVFDHNIWLLQLPYIAGQFDLLVTIPNNGHIDIVAAVVLIVSRNVISEREKS